MPKFIQVGDTIFNIDHVASVTRFDPPSGTPSITVRMAGQGAASSSEPASAGPGEYVFHGAEGDKVWRYFAAAAARE
jgi:hypothetical protein